MKLYHTPTSPYSRLVRIARLERGLAARIEPVEAATRRPDSPYYRVNPSGRVPFLVTDDGLAIEDSQLILLYLDRLGDAPPLCRPLDADGWAYGRLETYARSFVDGLSVYIREMRRPEAERSPTTLRHETDRALRLADFWSREVAQPLMQEPLNVAQLLLVVGLDVAAAAGIDLESSRPGLTQWAAPRRARGSVALTARGADLPG